MTENKTIVLDVSGMKCAGCVSAVEKQLTSQAGVTSARVNLLTGVAAIELAPDTTPAQDLAAKLTASGFPSQPRPSSQISATDRVAKYQAEAQQLLWQLITAGVLLVLSAIGHFTQPTTHLHHSNGGLNNFWWHWGLATLAILFPGRSLIVDGAKSFWHRVPNMNTLIGIGTIASYTASVIALFLPSWGWECFFEEPVMIIGFILLGRTLEQQAKHRAARAFDRLLSLQPPTARLVSEQEMPTEGIEIPVEQVKIGECLQVLPGEKIPADGEICAGTTTIDESMLTGESLPVVKGVGDRAIAGTINQSGAILVEVTRTGKDTTLAQIISLVEAAQTRKAKVQRLADTVAGYFTYGTLAIATFTFLFWYFIGIHNPHLDPPTHSLIPLKTAIAVMVIACPCALGLATPTALLVGTGIGAEQGLLIKGGDVLEQVQQLDRVVFDKTGTLTQGKPEVTDILTSSNRDRLLQLAASVESATNHPLAIALQQAAAERAITILPVTNAHTTAGLGVSAHVTAGDRLISVVVGNAHWLLQQDIAIDTDWQTTAEELARAGKTLVYVAVDGAMAGLIGVKDTLRPDAVETVKSLQDLGLQVTLLTGDRQIVADRIAAQLGITQVYAEVLPADKAQIIQTIQTENNSKVAMVGDGINDAPALAQADVGIAMNAGTDVAIEVADIILMRDRLLDVPHSISLARATFNKIRQNLLWAVIYNAIGIPAAAGLWYWCGWGNILSPSFAGAMMALSSVSVVTNSLLLRLKFDRVSTDSKLHSNEPQG
jgi:Cu2+-exporting ATPase